jgi:tetratricopeptide (TPR) repeat protein
MKYILALLLSVTIGLPAIGAGKTQSVITPFNIQVQDAKGVQLRKQLDTLTSLVKAKRFAEADVLAKALRQAYEKTFNPKIKQYTFQLRTEFEEFKSKSHEQFEWIDWGYGECIQIQAFLRSEQKDFQGALAILKDLKRLAPVSAVTAIETGYVFNQVGRFDEALLTYQGAEALAVKYPSQKPFRAAALRGMGFSLIELNRLNEAEFAFKQSLDIDPMNSLALNELAYIKSLRSPK